MNIKRNEAKKEKKLIDNDRDKIYLNIEENICQN